VDAALETLREVDVIILVFDASTRAGKGDEYLTNLLKDVKTPVVLVLNKIDLVGKAKLLPLMEQTRKWHDFAAIVPLSATTGDGVDRLERVLLDQMPEGEPGFPEDYLTDQPERSMVAETVREKVLAHTHAELPFSTAVVVDQFDESDRARIVRLYCTIYVEHDSQKPIVIGRGGEMIKRIGTEARVDLEKMLDAKVFLDLRVKVNADWRDDDRSLDEIGVPHSTRKPRRR
jgi:GTP-binding protein Era